MKHFIGKVSDAELYIGENAGKRIDRYIENAKSSIRIISPYIAIGKYKDLISKQEQGLKVSLLTSADERHFHNAENSSLLKNVIHQKKTINFEKKEIRKWFIISSIFFIVSLIAFWIIISLTSGFENLYQNKIYFLISIVGIILTFITFTIQKNIKVYSYSYNTPFPIRFVIDPLYLNYTERSYNPNNTFFHVKLFIIDEEIAFLGSVNLTTKGMKYNFESCITITNKDEIIKLVDFFDEINQQRYKQKNIQVYGKKIYKEPIN